MTKLVTTAAVLHAMDQGLITSLDDSELVEKVCPDLCQLKILEGFDLAGKAVLVPRKNPITLKLLLSHTAGLAYEFTSSALTRWVKDNNHPAIFDAGVEAFLLPLTYEPGTRFRYSIGVDWAGILLERVSGKSLEDYFLENLFKPYGIKSLTFRRPANLEAKLQAMCTRERPHWGKIIVGGGARNLDKIPEHCMGGGGLFGTVTDYLRFLQTLLKCPSGKGPLKPETYKVLFKPAFPPLDVNNSCHEDMARFAMGQTWHDTTQARAWLYEYSTGLCINARDSIYGRKAGSGCWDGAAKSMYWIDPSTGVAVSRSKSRTVTTLIDFCRGCAVRNY